MKKIPKITQKEIGELREQIAKLSPDRKDYLIAQLLLVTDRLGKVLQTTILNQGDTKAAELAKREIEEIISMGPTWLNYTRKIKTKK